MGQPALWWNWAQLLHAEGLPAPMQPDHKEFLEALGQRLRGLRHDAGWTQGDMMLLHGYAESHWRKYENGRAGGLTVDTLLRIASVFNLSLVELMDGLGEFPRKTISAIERKAAVKTSARAARKTAARNSVVVKNATKTAPQRTSSSRNSSGNVATA